MCCIWSIFLPGLVSIRSAILITTHKHTHTHSSHPALWGVTQAKSLAPRGFTKDPWRHTSTCSSQTLWWLHCDFSTLSLFSGVCFCNWLKALPLIVSICQSIVWMRSTITDLARGQLDFSWFNWIYDMSQTQTSRDCIAMTASLLHIKKSFHNALWLWAWQMVKRDEIK